MSSLSGVMARIVLQQYSPNSDRKLLFLTRGSQVWSFLWIVGIILIYFCLSIGLTFYQRWFIEKFRYPLSVGLCHMAIKFLIATVVRGLWQCWHRRRRVSLNWSNTLNRVAPVGLVSGIDIAFSNWGLEYIDVLLYTMTKSTSIIFILMFALLFKLEKKSWSLFLIVGMISGGLVMFTYKSTTFNLLGFSLVLLASFSSGLRWTLAQFVMQKSDMGMSHPLDMLYHVQPWMFLSILPFALFFEGMDVVKKVSEAVTLQAWAPALHHSFLILMGALIAITMELTEYQVVASLSSLTLSVAGIFKEVVTMTLAVVWKGEEMSRINAIGLLMCLGGIVMHVGAKAAQQRGTVQTLPPDEASARFLTDDFSSSDEEHPDPDNKDNSSSEVLFSVLNSRDR